MSAPHPSYQVFVILCVDDSQAAIDSLVRDLRQMCGHGIEVEGYTSAEDLLERAGDLEKAGRRVPLFIADHQLPGMSGVDLLITLHDQPHFKSSRKLICSALTTLDDLSRALNKGALNANLLKPWTEKSLREVTGLLLTEWFLQHAPEDIDRLSGLLDVDQLSHAFVSAEQRRRSLDSQVKKLQRSFLFLADAGATDEDVEDVVLKGIDEALGHQEPETLAAGTILFEQGAEIDGIWILVAGKVQLYRDIEGEETVFHSQTVGRIIGLLALSHGGTTAFSCRALTDISVIKLSLRDLDQALQHDPSLSIAFVTVLLRSMARRNHRAIELQTEVSILNRSLQRERDQLTRTLKQLEQAQMRLVESEKMATLGQMAAGIAHELNNPIAAISRAAAFLVQDVDAIAARHPRGTVISEMVKRALQREPLSTRTVRNARKTLSSELGDPDLARRLTEMDILAKEDYDRLLSGEKVALEELEKYHQLGNSLRNLRTCAARITTLVDSLRSYARTGQGLDHDLDIHQGLDETLTLFGHELRTLVVEREFGTLPAIEARAGELNQVWTNLVSNALQVMHGQGTLRIETEAPDPGHVAVRIIDSGPGIPPENMDRIFDLNFTTRQGSADFGLGIGLPLCREIVARHQGTLTVESRPGRTCFTVTLPLRSTP
jgi:signal transduction histidine kinase/DNA-binding response OmpR family regulator